MRKLLPILALLLCALPACAGTFVQGCVNTTATQTTTCAMGSSVTAGNLLTVATKNQFTTGNTPAVTVTSSSGVACTWVVASAASALVSSKFSGAMYSCNIPSSGAETVQVAWTGNTGGSSFSDIDVAEYAPDAGFAWASPALDVATHTVKSTASTTCAAGTTATTTNANDLVIGVCEAFNAAQTWGTVTGYTNRATASRNTAGFYDKSVTAVGTQSFTVTIASDIDLGMIVTFKETASVGAVKHNLLQMHVG